MALGLPTKIGIGAALAAAIGYLVVSDSGEGVLEYMYVDKLMAAPQQYEGRTIRVHGIVMKDSIKTKKGTTGDYRFVIEHAGKRLPVHFTNIPPDTFQEGGEVILTGRLTDSGEFESDEMSAKCPSKYEEERASIEGEAAPGARPAAPARTDGQG
jgi:cytochrome c-type biogenesis protein CcmE